MYKILFSKESEDYFNKLDNSIKKRVGKKIEMLKENPHIGIPLTANLAGFWKLRIGDYRIIYQIKDAELLIFVIKIGHRKNIYK